MAADMLFVILHTVIVSSIIAAPISPEVQSPDVTASLPYQSRVINVTLLDDVTKPDIISPHPVAIIPDYPFAPVVLPVSLTDLRLEDDVADTLPVETCMAGRRLTSLGLQEVYVTCPDWGSDGGLNGGASENSREEITHSGVPHDDHGVNTIKVNRTGGASAGWAGRELQLAGQGEGSLFCRQVARGTLLVSAYFASRRQLLFCDVISDKMLVRAFMKDLGKRAEKVKVTDNGYSEIIKEDVAINGNTTETLGVAKEGKNGYNASLETFNCDVNISVRIQSGRPLVELVETNIDADLDPDFQVTNFTSTLSDLLDIDVLLKQCATYQRHQLGEALYRDYVLWLNNSNSKQSNANDTSSHGEDKHRKPSKDIKVDGEQFETAYRKQEVVRIQRSGSRRRYARVAHAPGTKWCGPGDRAENYWDLGPEVEADECCREHDHCPRKVEALSSLYGVFNWRPFAMVDCVCDQAFRRCLQAAGTAVSNMVGTVYFDMFKPTCLTVTTTHGCIQWGWWGRCYTWGQVEVATTRWSGDFIQDVTPGGR